MFPLILSSNNQSNIDSYIEDFKKEQNFPDIAIQIISPEKTTISINQIRELKKELRVSSVQKRLIIFQQFDSATLEAQNALLKVLEELNEQNQFILEVNQIGNVLPTIISRSKVIDLEEEKTVYDESVRSSIKSFLSRPRITFLSDPVVTVTTKENASLLLRICLDVLHEELHSESARSTDLIRKTFDLLYKLEHNNLSPQLTIDTFVISAIKYQ